MEPCKGLEDWLECLRCPYLCTKMCPIEGEDVMERMQRQIHLLSLAGIADNREAQSKEHDRGIY